MHAMAAARTWNAGADLLTVITDLCKELNYVRYFDAGGFFNVRAWRDGRFRLRYPGFEVVVVGRDGRDVHGATLLGTVRAEYR